MTSNLASFLGPILQDIPFRKILPALTAGALYANARWHLTQDIRLSKNYIMTSFAARSREASDRLNLFYRLEEWALSPRDANRAMLIYNGRTWTYGESYQLVLKYAAWLHNEKGVRKGDVVAIDCVNGDTFMWLWMAIWSLGAKPSFINYNLTQAPLIHSVKAGDPKLIIVNESVYQRAFTEEVRQAFDDPTFCTKGSLEVVVIDRFKNDIESQGAGYRAPDSVRSGQALTDMAILIYTSGTTGFPKPAVVSWSKVHIGGSFASSWLNLKPSDIMYTCMPLYHSSASLLAFGVCLHAGAALSLGQNFHRSQFWADVRSSKATVIQYVGETCRYLLSAPPSPLDKQHSVRAAIGNGLRPDVWQAFKDRFGIETIAEFYGATEGPSASWNISNNTYSAGAVGRLGVLGRFIFGSLVAIAVFDHETDTIKRDPETGFATRVGTDEPGELLYKLDEQNIKDRFQGYYNNSSATNKKILRDVFTPGDAWFSTGDLMRRSSDGFVYFCDRIGDTFRWKSENVSTAEVSDVLGRYRGIEEANVYGIPVPNHDGRAGCAAIVLNPKAKLEAVLAELGQHVSDNLPRYAIPIFLRVKSSMDAQRTGTNKQQKTALRSEGVDPEKVHQSNPDDRLFWLPPGSRVYQEFGEREWGKLQSREAKL